MVSRNSKKVTKFQRKLLGGQFWMEKIDILGGFRFFLIRNYVNLLKLKHNQLLGLDQEKFACNVLMFKGNSYI